jgi:Tfp pilus assembly protein PilF
MGKVDFFVSYTSADRPWAEWIAWELEHAGYSVRIQAWDFGPGTNFVHEMDKAARVARRTIAVLSPAFLESPYAAVEWQAAFREDPTGERRKLVPVRVRDCDPGGLLGSIVYVDVVGLPEIQSRAKLLAGVTEGRAKPAGAPAFPGAKGKSGSGRVWPPEAGAAIFNVPVATHTFVGRQQQLRRLEEGLSGDGVVAITQVRAIHGMGGVGKTQLAARYAREHRDNYDVIWWLRAEQPLTLHADLASLAVALGLVGTEAEEQDAMTAARGWLEINGRWLLVFDNVPVPDAIADLLPEGSGGHVLITSRAHADWRALHAEPLALDVWQRTEAVAFLRERTGEQDSDAEEMVAQALGDLPLALEQAAAYANAKAITLTGYTERLRDRAPELFAAGRPAGYEHTVATVWQMAFEEIAQHPIAHGLLGVCAHLAPERIPRELLAVTVEHNMTAEVGQQATDDAIELLLRYALLMSSSEQTFGMHRLIGQLTRDRAEPASRAHAATAAVTALASLWPTSSWEHEQWPACQRLLAPALAATAHSLRYRAAPEHTASVLGRVGQYQEARARLTSAQELTERALAIKETIYGPEDPAIAATLSNLGVMQEKLAQYEAARATQQRALAIFEAAYGPEHPVVGSTLTNLGTAQHSLEQFEAARATLQRALTIFETSYGPEDPQIAFVLTNLGNVQRKLGEFEQGRAALQRALAINEATYGPEHRLVSRPLMNLGAVQQQLGELDAARATQQRALAICEATYGPEHPQTAIVLTNLGIVQAQLDNPEQGHAALQRALAINEAVYGPEHPQVASTLANLSNVQQQLGELAAARVTLQRALAINEALYGPEHPRLAITLDELGVVQTLLEEFEPARASLQRALAITRPFTAPSIPRLRAG